MAASPYQRGFTFDRSDSRVAARKAAEACPDGKLLVSGWRSWWGWSASWIGRSRLNADFTTPLTSADSAPNASARRVASRVPSRVAMPVPCPAGARSG